MTGKLEVTVPTAPWIDGIKVEFHSNTNRFWTPAVPFSSETPFHVTMVCYGRDSCYKFAMASERSGEIERAQTLTHYPIGTELFTRIKYGDECFGWRSDMTPCHDCGVAKGQLHIPCCEVEECPNCHTQLLSCECDLRSAD